MDLLLFVQHGILDVRSRSPHHSLGLRKCWECAHLDAISSEFPERHEARYFARHKNLYHANNDQLGIVSRNEKLALGRNQMSSPCCQRQQGHLSTATRGRHG